MQPGLELKGVVPMSESGACGEMVGTDALPPAVQEVLASCHGLALLGSELVGDPLDQVRGGAWQSDLVLSAHVIYRA